MHGGVLPLRHTEGHGAAHFGKIPDVAKEAPCPSGRGGERPVAPGTHKCHDRERPGMEGGHPLLRGGHDAKGRT